MWGIEGKNIFETMLIRIIRVEELLEKCPLYFSSILHA